MSNATAVLVSEYYTATVATLTINLLHPTSTNIYVTMFVFKKYAMCDRNRSKNQNLLLRQHGREIKLGVLLQVSSNQNFWSIPKSLIVMKLIIRFI